MLFYDYPSFFTSSLGLMFLGDDGIDIYKFLVAPIFGLLV